MFWMLSHYILAAELQFAPDSWWQVLLLLSRCSTISTNCKGVHKYFKERGKQPYARTHIFWFIEAPRRNSNGRLLLGAAT
jgi:hypothetical protein